MRHGLNKVFHPQRYKERKMTGFLILIGTLVLLFLIGNYMLKQDEKLMREGRPIEALIEYIRPVSSDDSGNTTVEYVLSFEGRKLKDRRTISTFYAPQLQPGNKINIIYKDDKNYLFNYDNHAKS